VLTVIVTIICSFNSYCDNNMQF